MKIDWRVSAIAAGSAFFLSVLVGVIGNVSFGVLILRAIVAAGLFGAGAIGVTIVVDRYLPDLRRASPAPVASPNGSAVDIVVEGDDDLGSIVEESEENELQSGVIDSGVNEAFGDDGEEMSVDDPDGVLEEVEEGDGTGENASVSSVSAMDEITETTSGDDLPSVDSMTGSFAEIPLGEESVVESSDSGGDPELMARAIRTVLKREE